MPKLDPEDLLAAWQVIWGQLDSRWHSDFKEDPFVEQIIWYDSQFVYPSLKKYQKLSEVLRDIKENTIIEDRSVDIEVTKDFIRHLAEREAILESRKVHEPPKPVKPNPKDMSPPEPVEITMEDLRNQPGEKHWR